MFNRCREEVCGGGGKSRKGEEGSVAVGVGVSMLNSAKITRTSAAHLECSQ